MAVRCRLRHTLRSIDMVETDVNGLIDLAGTDILGDLPGAKADLRDLAAVVELDLVKGHRGRVTDVVDEMIQSKKCPAILVRSGADLDPPSTIPPSPSMPLHSSC